MEGLRKRRRSGGDGPWPFGATRWEACQEVVRDAIAWAMIPTINSMMVTCGLEPPGIDAGPDPPEPRRAARARSLSDFDPVH